MTAGAVAALAAIVIAVVTWGGGDDEPPMTLPGGEEVTIPDVVGMRLDEARLELAMIGFVGPSLRTVDGASFPDDLDLETITRVVVISPPAGSTAARDAIDLTLYLEQCDGACTPRGS